MINLKARKLILFGVLAIGMLYPYDVNANVSSKHFLNNASQFIKNRGGVSSNDVFDLAEQALNVPSNTQEIIHYKSLVFHAAMSNSNNISDVVFWGEKFLNEFSKYKNKDRTKQLLNQSKAIVQRIVGIAYFKGVTVQKNKNKGMSLIKKACQGKDKQACEFIENL